VQKLKKELAERFGYTVNGVQPGEQLLPVLQHALPSTETTDFPTLLPHWKNGVVSLQRQDLIDILWEQYLTREAGQRSMQEAVDNFISKLPAQESLINALLDARYYKKQREIIKHGSRELLRMGVEVVWRPVRVLMGIATEEIVEQVGLESLANLIRARLQGNETVIVENGEIVLSRLTAPLEFTVALPIHVVQGDNQQAPYAVPNSLANDTVKLSGSGDGHYQLNIQRIYTESEEPQKTAPNTYRQRIVIATQVIDPPISTAISASLVVGTEITMSKNAHTYSIDFLLDLESQYDATTDTYTIEFAAPIEIRDEGSIVQNINLDTFNPLELKVHQD
jgi:hypothetical protein